MRIYALVALAALLPLELARWHYDRGRTADGEGRAQAAETELAAAARLDPQFPLYPMRLALLRARRPEERGPAAALARRAAELGGATPSLWLVAGVLGYSAKEPWAGAALEKACALDPLDPFPPFYAMLVGRTGSDAPAEGAQALLNEPRLAAALFWGRHPDLFAGALAAVRGWPGVDDGWKQAFLAAAHPPDGSPGPALQMVLAIDTEERESLSLTAFRRRPWPSRWGLIQVRRRIGTASASLPRRPRRGPRPGSTAPLPAAAAHSLGRPCSRLERILGPLPISTTAVENLVGKTGSSQKNLRRDSGLPLFEQNFVQSRQVVSLQQVEKSFPDGEGVFVENASEARAEIPQPRERVPQR